MSKFQQFIEWVVGIFPIRTTPRNITINVEHLMKEVHIMISQDGKITDEKIKAIVNESLVKAVKDAEDASNG